MSANCYLTFEDFTLDPKFTFRKRKCWRILGHLQLKSISLIILGFAKERVGDRFDERQGKRPALRLLVRFSRREQVTSFTSWQDPCTVHSSALMWFHAPATFVTPERGLLGSRNDIHERCRPLELNKYYT